MQAAPRVENCPPIRATILLIARSAENARPYREALEAAGHRVNAASDAVSALRRAVRAGVDVVLVEADAEPLDGLAVAAILGADRSTSGLPVLILAEREDRHLRRRAAEIGAAGVLVQPVPARLAAVVAVSVGGREPQPAPPLVLSG